LFIRTDSKTLKLIPVRYFLMMGRIYGVREMAGLDRGQVQPVDAANAGATDRHRPVGKWLVGRRGEVKEE